MSNRKKKDTLRGDITALKKWMEKPYNDFIHATSVAVVAWYESEMIRAVRDQHERSRELGALGMIELKTAFETFSLESKAVIARALGDSRLWSHLESEQDAMSKPAGANSYTLNRSGKDNPLVQALAELYGRLGGFLRANGYQLPKGRFGVIDRTTRPDTLVYIQPIQASPSMTVALDAYSAIHQRLIAKRELRRILKEERAKKKALALWYSVPTIVGGQAITWNKAWDHAFKIQENATDLYPWGEDYLAWLRDVKTSETEQGFDSFLRSTDNLEVFHSDMMATYTEMLTKAVQKQLGMKDLDKSIMQAIGEQANGRIEGLVEFHIQSFDGVLHNYLDNEIRCPVCRTSCDDSCESCGKCQNCCKCWTCIDCGDSPYFGTCKICCKCEGCCKCERD